MYAPGGAPSMDVQQGYAEGGPLGAPAGWREWMTRAIGTHSLPAFLILALAIVAFRLAALAVNGTDLYMDEAQYWAWSQAPALGYFSKPPLIAWIIHGATAVCGDGEACVRLPSVLLHFVTAVLVYLLGWRLYAAEVGFWAGLAYLLLPAVSLSSGIISTDVPLLAAWALALFAFAGLLQAPNVRDAALLALALGAGLNAKYAMAYFLLCGALYFALVPEHRPRLRDIRLWLALALGLALIVPNVLWNMANGFVTFAHTAENANWSGIPFHPGKAAEFIGAQFGVFGPIMFGAFLVIVWRAARQTNAISSADKLLLFFSVPIIAVVATQALISRAHANWAAPAYIAAVVLVTAVMLRDRASTWMRGSFAVNGALALLVAGATWQAGRLALPVVGDPFARTLGNRELAALVENEIGKAAREGHPIGSVLTDDREIAAALAYYGRGIEVPVLSWRTGAVPRSHFEIARPYTADAKDPVLLVSPRAGSPVIKHFGAATDLGTRAFPAGRHATRTVHVSKLVRSE